MSTLNMVVTCGSVVDFSLKPKKKTNSKNRGIQLRQSVIDAYSIKKTQDLERERERTWMA